MIQMKPKKSMFALTTILIGVNVASAESVGKSQLRGTQIVDDAKRDLASSIGPCQGACESYLECDVSE